VVGAAKSEKPGDDMPAVFALSRPSRCHGCDCKLAAEAIVQLNDKRDEREVFCLSCAKLGHLEFLRPGNAKITRLAKKYSSATFAVLKWSDMWKCYERHGLLVEPQAIDRAEEESGDRVKGRQRAGNDSSMGVK
jgi:hypothetical protein